MKTRLFVLFLTISFHWSQSQDIAAYKIYTSTGESSDFTKMIASASNAGFIFVGELHNNSIAHWMELKISDAIYSKSEDIVLAMEMFEADDQIVLTEYLNDVIREDHLTSEAKVWKNYETDYKPLIEFAKENNLKVIASNVPRRYANLVYRRGLESLDSLDEQAKNWIAPLPIKVDLELPGYKSMIAMMGGHGDGAPENIAYAQAVKDATMGHFIMKNKTATNKVIHFNGSYHSQNHEGIVWYVQQTDPKAKIITIQVVEQDDVSKLDDSNKNKADFIIVVPGDMTKTY